MFTRCRTVSARRVIAIRGRTHTCDDTSFKSFRGLCGLLYTGLCPMRWEATLASGLTVPNLTVANCPRAAASHPKDLAFVCAEGCHSQEVDLQR